MTVIQNAGVKPLRLFPELGISLEAVFFGKMEY
jgi:hypothetical protein